VLPPPPPDELPPPHEENSRRNEIRISTKSTPIHFFFRRVPTSVSTTPISGRSMAYQIFDTRLRLACGAVVLTVRVAWAGVLPVIFTVVDEHVGAGLALVATEQVRLTLPVKPADGVTVTEKFIEPPALTVPEDGFDASAKLPVATTFTATVL